MTHVASLDQRRYAIASVDRALDLLAVLARHGPASLADIAKAARCTRTAAFRLLRTLEAQGFAIQDSARGAWRLGARLPALGRAASAQGALAAAAAPVLAALGEATGECVCLRVRDGLESETVAAYRPHDSLRLFTRVGERRPLHAGTSRLLLAYAPQSIQRQVVTLRLPRFTQATRIEPGWIEGDLARIRARGWLVTTEEVEPGATGIAAPVRDGGAEPVAILFVAAPTLRIRPQAARGMVPAVVAAASRLSGLLGEPVSAADPTQVPPAPPAG